MKTRQLPARYHIEVLEIDTSEVIKKTSIAGCAVPLIQTKCNRTQWRFVVATLLGEIRVSKGIDKQSKVDSIIFETLTVNKSGGVLFVEMKAPPMNLMGPELVGDLALLIKQPELDTSIKVIVFKSGDPDYFISHVDVTRIKENREAAAKLGADASIGLMLRHLSTSRLISIAQIEGPALVANSSLRVTCDSRREVERYSVNSSLRSE